MAHQLRAEGETVELVALFDTFAPDGMKGLPLGRRMAIHLETFLQKGHSYILEKVQAKISSSKEKVLSIIGKMSSKFDQEASDPCLIPCKKSPAMMPAGLCGIRQSGIMYRNPTQAK